MATNNASASRPTPTPSSSTEKVDFDREFMLRELNLERQRAVVARDLSLRERKLIDASLAKMQAVTMAAGSVTVPVLKPTVRLGKPAVPEATRIFGMSAPMLQGALLGAIPGILAGLVAAYYAPPGEQVAVWKETVANIVAGMGLGGTAGYLMDKITRALLELGAKLSDKAWLGSTGKVVTGFASTVAFAAIDIGYQGVRWFYHFICYHWAKNAGDIETADIESEAMGQILSLDNACIMLAHILTQAASTSAAAWIAAGGLGLGAMTTGAVGFVTLAFPAVAVVIADAIARGMIRCKNKAGGWAPWVRSWFVTDRRPQFWAGEEYEERYHEVFDLWCEINLTVVVDPVRSTFTGRLYERAALFRWLDKRGVDPIMRGERATRLDYIAAPVAKKWAHAWAREVGAHLEVVVDQGGHDQD